MYGCNVIDEEKRYAIAKKLHQLARFVETAKDLPLPALDSIQTVYVFVDNIETLARAAKALGNAEKDATDIYFNVTADFGLLKLQYTVSRGLVCTPKVVGKKTITTRRQIAPPVYEDAQKEIDILEWECPPSLLELVKNDNKSDTEVL